MGLIPTAGHSPPISIEGFIAESKNNQKIEKKNIPSLNKKREKENFNAICIWAKWLPAIASIQTVSPHIKILNINATTPINTPNQIP